MADRAIGVPESDRVLDRPSRERRLHPDVDRVPDDPVREHVLDRAKVNLAFAGVMFGDVGQPDLVRAGCFEAVNYPAILILGGEEVVMDRWSRPAGLAPLPGMAGLNAADPAKAMNPVLRTPDSLVLQLVGEEPVTKRGVFLVKVNQLVDHQGVIEVTPADRCFEPLVIALGREPKDPARHRHRHPQRGTGRGHLTDEREHYFPGRFA